ncbi:MAG: VPS10 domain-containing protein [Bacteroidota bacterium]
MTRLLLIILIAGSLFSCASIKTPQEFKENTVTRVLQYGPDTIHARGIAAEGNYIYTANDNGFVYQYDRSKNTYKQLTQLQQVELRDIHVISEDYFIALQSDPRSSLLLSKGLVEQFVDPFLRRTFLDGLDINDNGHGIVMGDPINSKLQVAVTHDYGLTWEPCESQILNSEEGEAGFAASGSNVQVINDSTFVFVSGGKISRFFKTTDAGQSWISVQLPFLSSEASGPFSVHFKDEKTGFAVGGNYLEPNDTTQNCFFTTDGGFNWNKPSKTTSGYKSSVIYLDDIWYACGTNGIDFSIDNGRTWYKLNDVNCFALAVGSGKIYATMTRGRVMEITPPKR